MRNTRSAIVVQNDRRFFLPATRLLWCLSFLFLVLLDWEERGSTIMHSLFRCQSFLYVRAFRPALQLQQHPARFTAPPGSTNKPTGVVVWASSSSSSTKEKKQQHLVIVESPAKCSTIEKILNDPASQEGDSNAGSIQYTVTSCMGHIRNLAKTKLPVNTTSSSSTNGAPRFPYNVAGIDLDSGHYTPHYTILEHKRGTVTELQRLADRSDTVLLATDPDREGEAMAWHLRDVLGLQNDSNDTKKYQRIRFSEITASAVRASVHQGNAGTTRIDDNLVAAQETRRVLDRLAGYTVSPILWKKIAPGLSAGRVQSVGLHLIVSRELQRLRFETTRYYDIAAELEIGSGALTAKLQSINGTAIANAGKDFLPQGRVLTEQSKHKYHMESESDALQWVDRMATDSSAWTVHSISSTKRTSKSPPPFKTSTLQQAAVRRLGLPVQQAMRVAQQLYEAGYISYMRTDSTQLSSEAIDCTVQTISSELGPALVADATTIRSMKKDKHAQEAHEAIRPAIQENGTFLVPEQLEGSLPSTTVELYRMIYQRTLAHRMPSLITNQTQVVIRGVCDDTEMLFRTSGSVVVSPGYTTVYNTALDDATDENDSPTLPALVEGQVVTLQELVPVSHDTQPPARFTEASFVKELEALGVGRPSTYAGIVQILRDRAYVGSPSNNNNNGGAGGNRRRRGDGPSGSAISAVRAAGGEAFAGGGSARGPLVPSLSAIVVCALLEKYCPTYIDPSFTAKMETRLDEIASGSLAENLSAEMHRIAYLDEFYAGENGLAAQIKHIEETVDASEARRAVLPSLTESGEDNNIGLFIGPWGPYIQEISQSANEVAKDNKPQSAPLPPSMASDISVIDTATLKALLMAKQAGGVVLGQHPEDGRNIRLMTGRYGAYLQWGDSEGEGTTSHSLPRHMSTMRPVKHVAGDSKSKDNPLAAALGITLDVAIGYVGLPRTVTTLEQQPIIASIGPYGPYLKYNNTFMTLKAEHGDVLTIDGEDAVRLVTDGIVNKEQKLGRGVLAEIGEMEGSKVLVKSGLYGIYLNWKRVNAKLPTEYSENPEEVPLAEAWALIQAKAGSSRGKKASKRSKQTKSNLPPPPKRSMSAYLHFCAAKRPEVAKTTKTLGEVSKKLALLWADANLEGREPYVQKAKISKLEYLEKKAAWEKECNELMSSKNEYGKTSKVKKTPKRKQNGYPKRPRSAYIFFCSARRSAVSKELSSLGAISKELARQWAETTDRTEFDDLAVADKLRFKQELSAIETVDSSKSGRIGTTRKPKGSGSGSGVSSSGRAPSAYIIFCRERRPAIVQESQEKLPFGEITKRLAAQWHACDNNTRKSYERKALDEKKDRLGTTTEDVGVAIH